MLVWASLFRLEMEVRHDMTWHDIYLVHYTRLMLAIAQSLQEWKDRGEGARDFESRRPDDDQSHPLALTVSFMQQLNKLLNWTVLCLMEDNRTLACFCDVACPQWLKHMKAIESYCFGARGSTQVQHRCITDPVLLAISVRRLSLRLPSGHPSDRSWEVYQSGFPIGGKLSWRISRSLLQLTYDHTYSLSSLRSPVFCCFQNVQSWENPWGARRVTTWGTVQTIRPPTRTRYRRLRAANSMTLNTLITCVIDNRCYSVFQFYHLTWISSRSHCLSVHMRRQACCDVCGKENLPKLCSKGSLGNGSDTHF